MSCSLPAFPGVRAAARVLVRVSIAALVLPTAGCSAVFLWNGTSVQQASWSQGSLWSGGTPPGTADDVWLNVSDAWVGLPQGVSGVARQIIVGRSVTGAKLDVSGGTLSAGTEVIVGQYAGAQGLVEIRSGAVTTSSNFSVGGTGEGELRMSGGTLTVGGTLHVNRYTASGAKGQAEITGGAVSAGSLYIGPAGVMTLDNTTVTLTGDRRTVVNGYIASNQLRSGWGAVSPLTVAYSSATNRTTITAGNGRHAGIAAFGPEVLGAKLVAYDYTGVRRLQPAPAPGVHPRVHFTSEELPALRARLALPGVGADAMQMVRIYTRLLREGRGWYDQSGSLRFMPDGSPRITNVGVYSDRAPNYAQLIANDSSVIATLASSPLCSLGGIMALEAFECHIDATDPSVPQRRLNVAAALDTWARWALTQSDLSTTSPWKFGEGQTALVYDLAHGWMTQQQILNVRKALARVLTHYMSLKGGAYYGAPITPEAVTSNWATLDTFMLLVACAIEGETTTAVEGLDSAAVAAWFTGGMKALHKFHTYGWWSNGAPYEGQGKNYLFSAHQIAFARRGYDSFGHPHVRAYPNAWIPAVTQPFGYAFTAYDVMGGTGSDPVRGGWLIQASDFIGSKWMYPDDTGVDFAWRNYVRTEYTLPGGAKAVFNDLRDHKFNVRDARMNNLLAAAVFASDVASSDTWQGQNGSALGSHDFLDTQGGTLVARSGFDAEAAALHVHVRQDFGGHTHADRGAFTFAALGRLFLDYNSPVGTKQSANMQGSEFNSVVLVDNQAMFVTQRDGKKMRIPAKIAAYAGLQGPAVFLTGDSTYAYTHEWEWFPYTAGSAMPFRSGFSTAETATFNHFRHDGSANGLIPDNRIVEPYGNTPFSQFPYWNGAGMLEGVQKRPFNPMRQVYRTAGLVRGVKPYALIFDDIRKDDTARTYKWLASMANDLEIVTGAALPVGANPATDVVLREPAASGNRSLLVRILRADGTPVQAPGSTGSALAYRDIIADSYGDPHARLVIERASIIEPGFRVLLFPFRTGEALPATSVSGNTLTVTLGQQQDTITFHPRTAVVGGQTVTLNEFTFARGGTVMVDYRDLIEPITIR